MAVKVESKTARGRKKPATSKSSKQATKSVAKQTKIKSNYLLDPKQLLEAGVHFGHQISRWQPKMDQYIFASKNGVHIIDLMQSAKMLNTAAEFAFNIASSGGQILFVGTKRQARQIIEEVANNTGMPYVTQRWLGGMLTNFSTIGERIKKLKKLENDKQEGKLDVRTKKEMMKIDSEISKLNLNLSGIREMKDLPKAVFIVDMPREIIAIREARILSIPVIAMADSNSEVSLADYPIPANDDAIKSIRLITETIGKAILDGRKIYESKVKEETKEQSVE